VVDHVRKWVDSGALGAPFLVLADAQSEERDRIAGRVPADGSKGWNADQWKQVAKVVAEAAKVTEDFGLDLVFHPHISTYVETMEETSNSSTLRPHCIGLCLEPVTVPTRRRFRQGSRKIPRHSSFRSHQGRQRDRSGEARRKELNFEQAIELNAFTIIGQGSIDFKEFFRVLEKTLFWLAGGRTGRKVRRH